jgi:hypothetical protein
MRKGLENHYIKRRTHDVLLLFCFQRSFRMSGPIFKHPFTCIISGQTGSGKTEFLIKLLQHMKTLIQPSPERIIWCYGEYQNRLTDMEASLDNIHLVTSIDEAYKMTQSGDIATLLILDDCMSAGGKSQKVADLFTKGSHHRNLSVILVLQNLFHRGPSMRDIHLNAHYVVLFKSPRDRGQVGYIGRQAFPGQRQYFMEAYQDATRNPYGYLLLDFKPHTADDRRLKSQIFPDEALWVYVPRDSI